MLLVFGLVNATKQLIGEIVGTFLRKFRMQTSFSSSSTGIHSRSNLGTSTTGFRDTATSSGEGPYCARSKFQ